MQENQVKEGDVVLILGDLASEARYHVRKIKKDMATVMTISPAEDRFEIKLDEIQKVDLTLDEARKEWSRVHGYSGI